MLRDALQKLVYEDARRLLFQFGFATLVAIILYYFTKKIVYRIEHKIMNDSLAQTKYAERLAHLVGSAVFITCMVFTTLIFFEIMGVGTALIIGWLTISLWFAMDTTIGNMVAGVMLLTHKKIKVWQSIKLLGSINQLVRIEEFHIRYTVLRNLNKQRIIVPNMILLHTPIQTKKTESLLRWEILINLSRLYDLEIVRTTLLETINAHASILHHDQTVVLIKSFTAKWYELICYYYYSPTKGKKVDFIINSELRNKIKYALEARGMKLTYNRQVIRIDPELV